VEVLYDQSGRRGSPTSDTYRVSLASLPKGAKADQALRRLPGLILADGGLYLIGATSPALLYVNEVPASIGFIRTLNASDLDQVEIRYRDTQSEGEAGAVYITLRRETTTTLRGDLLAQAGVLRPEYRLHPSLSLYTQRFDLRLFSAFSYSLMMERVDESARAIEGCQHAVFLYGDAVCRLFALSVLSVFQRCFDVLCKPSA